MNPYAGKEEKSKHTTRTEREQERESIQFVILTYISAIYHLILGKTLINQNKKKSP